MDAATLHSPQIGAIVLYLLTAQDAAHIQENAKALHRWVSDYAMGDTCAMVVTRSWRPGLVNGKLILDGDCDLVVSSRSEGEGNGQWHLKTWGN